MWYLANNESTPVGCASLTLGVEVMAELLVTFPFGESVDAFIWWVIMASIKLAAVNCPREEFIFWLSFWNDWENSLEASLSNSLTCGLRPIGRRVSWFWSSSSGFIRKVWSLGFLIGSVGCLSSLSNCSLENGSREKRRLGWDKGLFWSLTDLL